MQPKSANSSDVYQYAINDYYPNLNKTHGVDIIKNQPFHFVDYNMRSDLPKPYWIEMYDTNFTFPNGLEPELTPGGAIFEAYVKFPNEQAPYRMAVNLGRNYTTDTSVTVLSTHTNPQAGYTIYHGTIRLLVNWDKIHSELYVNGINDTYGIGAPIDFQINAKGFDYFDAGQTPDIRVVDSNGKIIWKNQTYITLCCPAELIDYDRQFNFSKLGGPISINNTGSFNFEISYGDNKYEKQFFVNASPNNTSIQYTGIIHGVANVTNTNFTVNYTIEGGKVLGMIYDTQSKSITVSAKTIDKGVFTVILPRALVDAKFPTGKDDKYYVLIDGVEANYTETGTTTINRTLSIPFSQDASKIEIIGSYLI
jgi:hypothetical protein